MDQNYGYGYSAPPPAQNSTMAIVSLVAGIAGLFIFPFIGSVIAVITGHMAKKEIAASQGRLSGDGLATGGLVTGYIGLALWLCGICAFVAYMIFVVGLVGASGEWSMLLPAVI